MQLKHGVMFLKQLLTSNTYSLDYRGSTMGRYKYLLKNIGLLTLSNFATKLLSFFLVPLYTSVLTTGEYGIYDLFNTTISLLVPLLTIDIQEAVLRFSMDGNADHNKIWRVGCRYSTISCMIVFACLLINRAIDLLPVLQQYEIEFMLIYTLTVFSGVIVYFSRGTGKIASLSIAGVISSVVMISCNIIFLLVFKMGLYGYFWASILGSAAQCIYLLISCKIRENYQQYEDDASLRKEMSNYSKPMVANAVSWWVNSASDRYIVTWLCGVSANGIYSVSYKIPSIISILQGIFSQAWTLSATQEFDPEDKSGFFINIYNTYNFLLVFACSALIFLDKPFAKFLFAKDFFSAWKYAPFLMISTVFSGMAAFVGGILSALKKSKLFAKSSVITAITNTILNIILVHYWGAIGAAISTAFAYFLMWIIRLKQVKKFVNLRVNSLRDLLAYLILVIQALMLLLSREDTIFCWYQLIFTFSVVLFYEKELKTVWLRLTTKFK